MKSNPPIRGHELISEGKMQLKRVPGYPERPLGGCRCGAKPATYSNGRLPSQAEVKRWHRAHKEALREGAGVSPSGVRVACVHPGCSALGPSAPTHEKAWKLAQAAGWVERRCPEHVLVTRLGTAKGSR